MKYTKTRVQRLLWLQDAFRDHVSDLVKMLGHRGSLETIDHISGTDLCVTTRWYDRCGGWESEDVKIPLDLLECDLHEAHAKIEAVRQEKRRQELAKHQDQLLREAEERTRRELAELERLTKKYENHNQGETP